MIGTNINFIDNNLLVGYNKQKMNKSIEHEEGQKKRKPQDSKS